MTNVALFGIIAVFKVLQGGQYAVCDAWKNKLRRKRVARKAREKSELGIYMVSLRGLEGVRFDDNDKANFLNIMLSHNAFLLGYTLLDDSFLFVLKEDARSLDVILRQTTIKFVKKYNKAYSRQGKVFAGRYISYPAQEMEQVWNFVSEVHSVAKFNHLEVTSRDNYFENRYVKSAYALLFFDKKSDFYNQCCNVKAENSQMKMSDEQIANYIIETFQIQPHNISKMPESLLQNILTQTFKVTKASARQIGRITALPLRMLWGIAKKIGGKNKKVKVKDEG